MKKILIISMLLVLVISGITFAESNFFGIQVYDWGTALNAISDVKRSDKGVSYSYNENFSNTSIYCFGEVKEDSITLTISNKSKSPIEFNYYMDMYEILTSDGTSYKMEMPDILDYPSKALNPNNSITIRFDNPVGNVSEIFALGVTINFGDTLIFLREIE